MHIKKFLTLWFWFAIIGNMNLMILGGASNFSIQENETVRNTQQYIYMPMILQVVANIPEVDTEPARWSHSTGQSVSISYAWSGDLANPSHTWRPAFQSGVNDWNSTATHVIFHYDSGSSNTMYMVYDPNGPQGKTIISYIPQTGVTVQVNSWGNLYWDVHWGYTNNQRQNVAEHEVGHMICIYHIPRNFTTDALMVEWTTLSEMEIIYTPQNTDVALVNQVYP